MKGTIKLYEPLVFGGTTYKELSYDTQKITGDQFLEADARANRAMAKQGLINTDIAENDNSLMMYLGMFAIIAETTNISTMELEMIKGADIMQLVRIGRFFMSTNSAAGTGMEESSVNTGSEENSSEGATEPIPDDIIQANLN